SVLRYTPSMPPMSSVFASPGSTHTEVAPIIGSSMAVHVVPPSALRSMDGPTTYTTCGSDGAMASAAPAMWSVVGQVSSVHVAPPSVLRHTSLPELMNSRAALEGSTAMEEKLAVSILEVIGTQLCPPSVLR